ncbi:MAG: N-acetylneuraminate synthase family protein [Negativicutes bacterium]|jgi:sialic acid synthase SpsE
MIHIIAEAGNNHNGKIGIAKKLVDEAVLVGADSVKFQIIYPEGLYLPEFYTEIGGYTINEVYEKRKQFMLTDDEYRDLAAYCSQKGIVFSASVFDKRGLQLLQELNVSYIKIASCDLNNYGFLNQAAATGKRIIVSTGMASMYEIEQAVQALTSTGNSDIVLMHCVSVYPCNTENMNLRFISELKNKFGLPVGFSDHSESNLAAVIATALGVDYLEKHLTMDRKQDGFDHAYAQEPEMMKQYIETVRIAERALQQQTEKLSDAEKTVKSRARRSVYAARDIEAGETIVEQDLLIVRPEAAIDPGEVGDLLGKTVTTPFAKFESLAKSKVK